MAVATELDTRAIKYAFTPGATVTRRDKAGRELKEVGMLGGRSK